MTFGAPVPLDPGDVSAAADVLVRSFADDPGLRFVLPEAADRERLGPALAHAAIRYTLCAAAPARHFGRGPRRGPLVPARRPRADRGRPG